MYHYITLSSCKCQVFYGGIFLNAFSKRLKEVRVTKNITQRTVAQFLGIKETSYQHYEYGKREPNYDTLIKLAMYFEVSTDYLLGITDRMEKLT